MNIIILYYIIILREVDCCASPTRPYDADEQAANHEPPKISRR